MTEAEAQRANDEAIGRLKEQIARGRLTTGERARRWVGVVALFVSVVAVGYTYTVQQAGLDCQASVIKNIATQNDITAAVGDDYRKYLAKVNAQTQLQADALTALANATSSEQAQAALEQYRAAIAEQGRLTQEYIGTSQTAADLKAKTPVVFQC